MDWLRYLLLEFSQMVGQTVFLQWSDPLDVSKVQPPGTQMDIIIIIYVTVKLQNTFISDSELQWVFTPKESVGLTAGRGCQPPWE